MDNDTKETKVVDMKPQKSLEDIVQIIKEKKGNFYFYVPNSKGVPSGAVGYVYDMVAILRENGFQATILHDKEYMIPKWMEGNFDKLPHISFEKLKVKSTDFLFLPEVLVQAFYADLNKSNIKLPCEVVVISQIYDLIYHSLDVGGHWYHFGIRNVITTTATQKEYIDESMRGLNVDVINPYIHSDFTPSEIPQKPFVLVYTRNKEDGEKIAKVFYQKYPQYRWIPFKFLSKSDRSKFANDMKECCLAVWVDDISSFGTFPLECMKSGVPVIGKIPEMLPEWMGTGKEGQYKVKDNGIWLLSNLDIPTYISRFIDEWITDTLNPAVYEKMQETALKYSKENTETQILNVFNNLIERRVERVKVIFEKQAKGTLEKLDVKQIQNA